ncbi:MAG: hypothetical protein AAF985_22660 [Bacteroidota bacterium]
MDAKTIQSLLDKYWEGQTSLEEEQTLKTYFQQEALPEEWKAYAPFFQMLSTESKMGTSSAFDKQLEEALTKETKKQPRPLHSYRWMLRAAAVLLLVSMSFLLLKTLPEQQQITQEEETYENPELAYAKAKEVLLLLSTKMQRGTEKASDGVKKAQKASDIIKLDPN